MRFLHFLFDSEYLRLQMWTMKIISDRRVPQDYKYLLHSYFVDTVDYSPLTPHTNTVEAS